MSVTSNKKGVQQLADLFLHHHVNTIVVSPGSRNAPLVVAFSSNENFDCFVVPDERSAAFFALGMAEAKNKPVALMCTSGSALLNYYPAIAEAFYRKIPLIVVSADRPSEWIDQGDGQTIRQSNVFKNHIKTFVEIHESPQTEDQFWSNQRRIEEALITATIEREPVHINFPLSEPLYQTSTEHVQLSRKLDFLIPEFQLEANQIEKLKAIWNASPKKLILCGQLPKNDYLNEQLKRIAEDKSVAIVVENTSNLQDRSFIHCIDRTITSFTDENAVLYQPDLLITLGGAVISKKVKSYLRKYQPKHHWKIGEDFPFMDTYQSLTISIPIDENVFCTTVLENSFKGENSRYGEQWKQLDYLARGFHDEFLQNCPFSDLSVFNFILDAVPDNSNLHLSNSSIIRYAQLFDPIKSINYLCNRGTSGIDGSMSTALGYSIASGKDKVNTLIIGDLSFFYDSNALWNHYLPTNFRIFLINNKGGAIFNIIDGPNLTDKKDEFFVAKHDYSAKYICKAFNVNYYAANSIEEIDAQLDEFYDVLPNNRPALMEIFTDNEKSSQILKDYFNKITVEKAPELKL